MKKQATVTDLELKRHAKAMLELYPASDRWYCTYDPMQMHPPDEKGKIKPGGGYKGVKDQPVTIELWEQHLLGEQALVIALALPDNTTKVTVVDIDLYFGLDVAQLVETIQTRDLPIYARYTKSKGAHLTVFHDEPVTITESVRVAEGVARMLGFVNTKEKTQYEIFPPLQKDPEKLPKVLNMPFLGSEGAFVKRTGAQMMLSEFLYRPKYLTAEQRAAIIKIKEPKDAQPTSLDAGRKYAEGKLRRYENELKNAATHGNNLINQHGFHMGTMVARDWIDREEIEKAFRAAIAHWSNQSKHLETLKRALDDGFKQPHPDLTDDEEAITEDGVALAFADQHAGDLRHDCDVGKWYQFSGSHWRRTNKPVAFTHARDLARQLSKDQNQRVINITSKASFAAAVERFAKADWVLATEQSAWDPDPYLLGTPDGTVDLRTGKLREARPEDYITKITGVGPSETAECPLWFKFMDEATQGNKELVRFLQNLFGYALIGVTVEQLFVFIHGGGGNGKGVFLNTIGELLGAYAIEAAPELFTETKFDRHPTELAELRGARLVTASETAKDRAWNETRIKSLTGGDKIKGRFMKQDFFEFVPQFLPTILGNEKPKLRDVSEAMRRRVVLVPFTHEPKVKDTKLREKLRAEWPGILRWLIDGCLLWQAEGITLPEIVRANTDEYFEEQDVFQQFMQFQFVRTKNETAKMSDTHMFSLWGHYAAQIGEEPGDKRWFNNKLRGHPYNLKDKPSNGVNYFLGIKLRAVKDDQAELDI